MSACQATGNADVTLLLAPGAGAASFTASNGQRLFPVSFDLGRSIDARTRNVLRGTADLDKTDVDEGIVNIAPQIVLEPGRQELDELLPLIMGADEAASDAFPLGVADKPFRLVAKIGDYYRDLRDCYVNTATIESSSGGSLRVTLECLGKTDVTITSGAFDALVADARIPSAVSRTVAFQDGAAEWNSTTINVKEFSLTINNNLAAQFFMSQNASCIYRSNNREIGLRMVGPLDSVNDILPEAGFVAGSAQLSFIASIEEFTIDVGALQWNNQTPAVPGPGEIDVVIEGRCLADGTTNPIEITNIANGALAQLA